MAPLTETFITNGKTNALYSGIINEIIDLIKISDPNCYGSVEKYIQKITHRGEVHENVDFSLLNGLVQEGKTRCVILIMWILNVKYGIHTPYITKNIDAVRVDALKKFQSKFINEHVMSVCGAHGLSDKDTKCFMLYPVIGKDLKLARGSPPARCQIPVYLMNTTNNAGVLKFFRSTLCSQVHAYTVFIIDEIHELFTDTEAYVTSHGLKKCKEGKVTVNNRSLITKIYQKCQTGSCGILGISATPYRAMVCDPACFVNDVYVMKPDPPAPGLDYYGYSRATMKLQNISVHENTDIMETVNSIMERSINIFPDGTREVKFINITTHIESVQQNEIYNRLVDAYPELLHIKLFIGKDTAISNDIPLDRVATDLDKDFFDLSTVSDNILQNGCIVLIGHNREGASITIKPNAGLGQCHRVIDEVTYSVEGITDQITSMSTSLEAQMQKFRIFGWYKSGHSSRIWCSKKGLIDIRFGIFRTAMTLENQYDTDIGPMSCKEIIMYTKTVKQVCSSDKMYSAYNGGYKTRIHTSTVKPDEGIELECDVYVTESSVSVDDYSSAPVTGLPNKALLQGTIKREMRSNAVRLDNGDGLEGLLTSNNQMAYNTERYNRLLRAVAQPDPIAKEYKVNSYGFSRSGHTFDTIVVFKRCWNQRPRLGKDCNDCLADSCTEHCTPNTPLFWWDGEKYIIIISEKTMDHKYIMEFENWYTTPEHQEVLDAIDGLIDKMIEGLKTGRRTTVWDIFGDLCKDRLGIGRSSSVYQALKEQHPELLKQCCEITKTSETKEELFIELRETLYMFFDRWIREHPDKEPNARVVQSRVKAIVKPKPTVAVQTMCKAIVKPKPKVAVQTRVKAKPKPKAKVAVQSRVKVVVKPKTKVQARG